MEATITTEPPPRSRMAGRAARVICSEPKRLVSMILRQMARSTSSKLWKASKRNALLTSTSMPPNSSAPAAIRRAQASASVMSVGTAMAGAPSADTSASDVVEGRLAPRRQHQVGPVRGQRPRRLAAQARADARHHAHLARQQPGRGRPSPLRSSQSSWAQRRAAAAHGRPAIRAGVTRA